MRRSVTAKIQPDRVRDMVRRRGKTRSAPSAEDLVVPKKISIRTDAASLSPFVLRLKDEVPTPAQLIASEDSEQRLLGANLLLGDEWEEMRTIAPAAPVDAAGDLRLQGLDIEHQIVEGIGVGYQETRPRVRKTKTARSTRKKRQPSSPISPKTIAITSLVPAPAPSDLMERLDLPEEDSEEESDAVVFEHRAIVPMGTERVAFAFALPAGWQRAIGAFVLVSFAFVLPLHAMQVVHELRDAKSQLSAAGARAASQLEDGAQAALVQDPAGAASSFARANRQFSQAQGTIDRLGSATSLILSSMPLTQKNYRAGKRLIEAGEHLSIAGERLANGMLAVQNEIDPTPASRMKLLSAYVDSALPDMEAAEEAADGVNLDAVPAEQQDHLSQLQQTLPPLVASLKEFSDFSQMALAILGADGMKRYLVVFQNNTEIRATGGFMGSFAEIDVQDGKVVRLDVPGGGTYDLQGSLKSFVAAPEPLQLLTPRWEFQDANWFPDFPTSARQMLDFYASAGGPSVDGVIAVNATYVSDLLALLGAIDMPEYDRTITSENFLFEAQKIVELEYDKQENKPKEFIGDLAPKLLDRVSDADAQTFLSVLDRVSAGLVDRDIQLYFTNDDLQKQILDFGWGGALQQTDGDYLLVVNTNLGGGKTDGVIADSVDVSVQIEDDGTIVDTTTITRTHAGIPGALFTGVNNVDYVRLYVPKGSELLSASGFSVPDASLFDRPDPSWDMDEDLVDAVKNGRIDPDSQTDIYAEDGKTVYGNWIQTKPGTSSQVQFTYRLPFKLSTLSKKRGFLADVKSLIGLPETDGYSLTLQKQSGVEDRSTAVHVTVPASLSAVWSSQNLDNAVFTNTTDAVLSALFEASN